MMVHQYGRYLLRRNTSTSVTFQQSNLFPYYICKEEVDPFTSSLFLKLKGEVISAKRQNLWLWKRSILYEEKDCTRMIWRKELIAPCRMIWRKGWIHSILQIVPEKNSYSAARNWINSVPQIAATTFAFCINPSSMMPRQRVQVIISPHSLYAYSIWFSVNFLYRFSTWYGLFVYLL